MRKVLIIDDEENIRYILSELLSGKGFKTFEASDGPSGIEAFAKVRPDAVLLDHRMPGVDGFETFKALRDIDSAVPVIFLTAHSEIHVAVEAMKTGAYDFITKPADMEALSLVLSKAIEKSELEREVARLKTAVGASIEGTLGRSEAVKRLIPDIVKVAATGFSIIIQGETGTGKSTLAGLIHGMSARTAGPFVRVDMGTIPETLIESELFGYEKGAFTGAERARCGCFESASGGTLFIDELENTSPAVQAKLLGAVEGREVCRVGSGKAVPIDVRLISASNRDLKELLKEKKIREDLFFRLNEFTVTLPPLRERPEDVPFLANKFLLQVCEELKKPGLALSEPALEALIAHPWPGNIRELKNVMRRAALVAAGREIQKEHLGLVAEKGPAVQPGGMIMPLREVSANATREAEKAAIRQALRFSSGNKARTASILKVDYKTLLTKIRSYNLE